MPCACRSCEGDRDVLWLSVCWYHVVHVFHAATTQLSRAYLQPFAQVTGRHPCQLNLVAVSVPSILTSWSCWGRLYSVNRYVSISIHLPRYDFILTATQCSFSPMLPNAKTALLHLLFNRITGSKPQHVCCTGNKTMIKMCHLL